MKKKSFILKVKVNFAISGKFSLTDFYWCYKLSLKSISNQWQIICHILHKYNSKYFINYSKIKTLILYEENTQNDYF